MYFTQVESRRSRVRNSFHEIRKSDFERFDRGAGSLAGRINEHSSRRNLELTRQVSHSKDRNIRQRQKHSEIVTKFMEDAETSYQAAIKQQEAKEKQLREIYKTMHGQWLKFKADNAATRNKMAQLKQEELYKQQDLVEEMQKKRERSIKAVEEFKKVQAHKFMLQMEQRKLHEADMIKVHARQKRLATRKKNDIMRKEQIDLSTFKDKRKQSQKLIEYRYRNRVQNNINSDMYIKTLDSWAKKGFNTSQLPKSDLDMITLIDRRQSDQKEYIRSARKSNSVYQ